MSEEKSNLEKLTKEFEEFAYIVSHDLKAPLRGIANITQWIEEDFGPDINEDIKDNFHLLKERVEKMSSMIDALTEYSRINRRNLDIADVDFEELFAEIKDDIEQRYPSCSIEVKGDSFSVKTYAKKLAWVIEELIENAAKHNNQAAEVKILASYELQNEVLIVSIRDSGKSVPVESVENLTKLFYTMEPKDKSKTTGAGLALAKKIVDSVEGTLVFEVQENQFNAIINWPIN